MEALQTRWVPFHRLARRLPGRKDGRHLHPAALYRWHKDGLRAADGERVRLEARRIGGQWCTTWKRLREFFARLEGPPAAEPMPETRQERGRAAREAEARLDRLGIRRPRQRTFKAKVAGSS